LASLLAHRATPVATTASPNPADAASQSLQRLRDGDQQ
jgi:hypothetical protein